MKHKKQQTIYVTEEEERMIKKLIGMKLFTGEKSSISDIYSESLRELYKERIENK